MDLRTEIILAASALGIIFIFVAVIVGLIIRGWKLSRRIAQYEKEIRSGREKWEVANRMIPAELFDLLKVSDVSEISFERQAQAETIHLYANSNEFSKIIHSLEAKEVFSFINQFLGRTVPQIYDNGGIVESFREVGMAALFFSEYEKALNAAISIIELSNELSEEKSDARYERFTVGICRDMSIVGVVGHPRRMSLLTLSERASGLSEWLQTIAEKYYARILITDSCLGQIPGGHKKYHVRFLGFVYIKNNGSIQKIYDVLDGDRPEIRDRKWKTRAQFEQGVLFFTKEEYQEARRCFIEVLKADRFDRAAKEYVYLCEYYAKAKEKKVYIDQYG